ncbi:prepronociceptin b [Aplochiton taeniatus]
MKSPLWSLVLLLSLPTPGRSHCPGECLACGLLMPQQQAFNTLVCLLECEGQVSSLYLTWELCQQAMKLAQYPLAPEEGTVSKRTGEELELSPKIEADSDNQLLYASTMDLFDHDQDGDHQEGPMERHSAQYGPSQQGLTGEDQSLVLSLSLEEGLEGKGATTRNSQGEDSVEDSRIIDLSKRFGGFLKGRHGYRKLIGSGGRPLQKRYGGFIGIRKSARKWNNEKRVNKLLKQYYLGMKSNRNGRFNSYVAGQRRSQL